MHRAGDRQAAIPFPSRADRSKTAASGQRCKAAGCSKERMQADDDVSWEGGRGACFQ